MEEKTEVEKVGGRIVDPQIVWLAQHGFRPDWNGGGWLLCCAAGSWGDTKGTCVRLEKRGDGPAAPWLAKVEVAPDDQWVMEGRVLLATAEGRTPDIAASRCIGTCRDREERLTDPIRTLARVLYATAMEDLREALPELVKPARTQRKEDGGGLETVGGSLHGQVTGAAEHGLKERKAAMWLAAHGFVPSTGAEGVTCWYRTCGGVPGVPEDGIEARLVTWRNSAGAWAADATVLLSGSRSEQCGITSIVVSSYNSLPDEGPDAALRGCVNSIALLAHSDEPQGCAKIARIVIGRYEKAMAEIEAKPASAG